MPSLIVDEKNGKIYIFKSYDIVIYVIILHVVSHLESLVGHERWGINQIIINYIILLGMIAALDQ